MLLSQVLLWKNKFAANMLFKIYSLLPNMNSFADNSDHTCETRVYCSHKKQLYTFDFCMIVSYFLLTTADYNSRKEKLTRLISRRFFYEDPNYASWRSFCVIVSTSVLSVTTTNQCATASIIAENKSRRPMENQNKTRKRWEPLLSLSDTDGLSVAGKFSLINR